MTPSRKARAGLLGSLLLLAALAALPATAAAKRGDVDVMTRNLYLGSGLSGATGAGSVQELVNEAGVIVANVKANDFRVRAKGLAQEIRSKSPDLVGLQEATLWRTGPCTANPFDKTASTVLYDYTKLLVKQLNKGKKKSQKYRVVVSQDEFDFEVYVNEDGDESTAAPGCPFGSESNGRQTMRDVILARRGVKTTNATGGAFSTLLQVRPGGIGIDVTRGWTAVDAKVKGAPSFRFVNVHFEAFDNQPSNPTNQGTDVGNGEVRLAQAQELISETGPARGERVILVGDLNSDSATPIRAGDELAHSWLLQNGFENRDTDDPLSCCLNSDLLAVDQGGKRSDFDHQVDHIMTGTPDRVKLRRSAVTGLKPKRGFWNSDHAGVFSRLNVR